MSVRGRRDPRSAQSQISDWFRENPDSEMSMLELQSRFKCSRGAVSMAVSRLKEEGQLESLYVIRQIDWSKRK